MAKMKKLLKFGGVSGLLLAVMIAVLLFAPVSFNHVPTANAIDCPPAQTKGDSNHFFSFLKSFKISYALADLTPTYPSQDCPSSGGGGQTSSNTPASVYVTVYSITCARESSLPNYDFPWPNPHDSAITINSSFALNYVNTHSDCFFEPGWSYTFGPSDNYTQYSVGTTGSSGQVTATYPGIVKYTYDGVYNEPRIYVNQLYRSNAYYGFTGYTPPGVASNNVSAEMRCHKDNREYDSVDYIASPVLNNSYVCIGFNAFTSAPATIRINSPDLTADTGIEGGLTPCNPAYTSGYNPCQGIYGTRDIYANPAGPTDYTLTAFTNLPGYQYPPTITSVPYLADGLSSKTYAQTHGILSRLVHWAEAASNCYSGGNTCNLGPGDAATFTIRYTPSPPPPPPSTCNIQVQGYLNGANQATTASFVLTGPSTQSGTNSSATTSFNGVTSGVYTLGSYPSSVNVGGTTYTYSSSDPTTINCPQNGTATFYLRYQSTPPGATNCVVNYFRINGGETATVNTNDTVTLTWSVSSVTSMTVDGVDSAGTGSMTRVATSSRSYSLIGNGTNGGSCSDSVSVTVNGVPPPPPPPPGSCTIDYFPNDGIYNGYALVQWQTSNASSLTLAGGPFGSGISVEPDGSRTIPLSSTTSFTLTGPGCSATAWMYAPTPPPPPPPTPCEIRTYIYYNNSFPATPTYLNYQLIGPATYYDTDDEWQNIISNVTPGTYTISYPTTANLYGYLSDEQGSDSKTVYCPEGGIARFYLKYYSRPVLQIR